MILSLPRELQFEIITHFKSSKDFLTFGQVCRDWRLLQSDKLFWKIAARALKIDIVPLKDIRAQVLKFHHRTAERVFSIMSCKTPYLHLILNERIFSEYFLFLGRLPRRELTHFLKNFHQIFQMTQGKDLRRRMIQDLQSSTKPQLIYRLRLSDLRALFYRNLSISLPGPLEVRVMDLNLENRRFVQNILEEQGQVSFDSVISLLNQPLHSLQQSISTISFGEVKKYDSAAHAITIDFPQGMCLSTRFNDMSMAFSDLKRRVSTRAFHIAPFQNLYVFDWSNELNAFFHHRISHSLPNPHFDLLPLVLDFFTRHLLKLNLHGNVWVSYEPWFNRILLCSEAFISVSKLPIESE